MLKGIQSLTLVLLVALAGCTTEPQRPGLPTWDFERDELKVQSDAALGALVRGLLGAIRCDLRLMIASDGHPEEEIIRKFEREFELKKTECAVLIVRASSDSNKWTVAGFNDAGEFRTVVIDDPNHELSKELIKDPANQNRSRIAELAISSLGRTRAILGATIGIGGVGGVIQDGIDLTPTELNRVISTALAPTAVVSAPTALSLNPTAATQWTISESNEGQTTTDWRPITGRKAGVLWWEKTYECEARHVITIKQSYRSHRLTNFTIVTEVRERPNANYPWASADPELGRASFENLKNVLLISVRAELDKRRAKK